MFTKLIVEGFKSFRERQEVPLKPLTLLAGANSSGKSSLMQPLLLLKQTFHETSDPGSLQINGPNVVFSRAEQMIWKSPGEKPRDTFCIGLEIGALPDQALGVEVVFKRLEKPRGLPSIQVEKCVWIRKGSNEQTSAFELTPSLSEEVIRERFAEQIEVLTEKLKEQGGEFLPFRFRVKQERSFLFIEAEPSLSVQESDFEDRAFVRFSFPAWKSVIEYNLRRIIHVPGLRGNPRRTYPVRAVEKEFPGVFQDYVASLISKWQRQKGPRIKLLNQILSDLGLTWKVRAFQQSDTEVAIQVGRTSQSLRGGARDLVNIADVGFGLSQCLPVLVALIAAEPGQLLYIEQPEIHLHPKAQVALSEAISNVVNQGIQVVLETHSQFILLGFQRLIAQHRLDPHKVILHWFQRDSQGASQINSTYFLEDGAFANPKIPVDFADISFRLMEEYLRAAWSTSMQP